jgi:hypothetical protein
MGSFKITYHSQQLEGHGGARHVAARARVKSAAASAFVAKTPNAHPNIETPRGAPAVRQACANERSRGLR